MTNKKLPAIHIGLPSIITIFIILCMVTFATLSLVSVMKDQHFTDSLQAQNDAYYNAYNQANDQIAALAETFAEARQQNTFANLDDSYSFSIPIDDEHVLAVTCIPQDSDALYTLTQFETIITKNWSGDDTLPLLKEGVR